MESRILLSFNSSLGETITITVPRIDPDIEEQVVKDCMAMLVASNIFSTNRGTLESPKSARMISTTETPVTIL